MSYAKYLDKLEKEEIERKTEVVISEYKGSPILQIWKVGTAGQEGARPIISFGVKKADVLLENFQEIVSFVDGAEL